MFSYQLIDHPDSLTISSETINSIFEALNMTVDKPQRGIINIACVSEEHIQTWNLKYREKDTPTDILTFPYHEDFSECQSDEVAGEILICLPEVAKKNNSEF